MSDFNLQKAIPQPMEQEKTDEKQQDIDSTNPYPIPQHRTWWIHDSSKIQTFMDCPRKYLFRYILGWTKEAPNLHLVFGESWHQAIEHIIKSGFTNESVGSAFGIFLNEYRKYFSETFDGDHRPKSPDDALFALQYYRNMYEHETDERELLYTEVAGTVPVDESRVLHFRIDAIFKTKHGILIQEHKTASKRSSTWVDQWFLKIQTGTYTHVAHCMFPDDTVAGLEINGMIFYKAEIPKHGKQESIRIPVNRSKEMMAVWLWNVKHWLNQIEWNMEELKKSTENDDVLSCFPMNTESCTKYYGCEYLPYCQIWSNPLTHSDESPPGFKVERWDPSERQETANKVVHLEEDNKEE